MTSTDQRPSRRATTTLMGGIILAVVAGACAPAALPRLPASLATPTPIVVAPSVAPVVRPQDEAIAAFVDRVASGAWTYRVTFKGDAALSADRLPVKGSVDVAGEDFATSVTYDLRSADVGIDSWRIQWRLVKGKGYVKSTGTRWQSTDTLSEQEISIPFLTVEQPEDVRYLGPSEHKGDPVHKVMISGAIIVHPATLPGYVESEAVDRTELELLIDDEGRPLVGNWKLFGRGRVGGGQLQHIDYELALTFSKVGAKIKISRP